MGGGAGSSDPPPPPAGSTRPQPFDRLNGGVSALMAEVTASIGCYVASGYRRLAGVQLSINHVGPAQLADLVQATAEPSSSAAKSRFGRSRYGG